MRTRIKSALIKISQSRSSLLKNASVLVSGTILSQVFYAASYPLITRLYSQETLGQLALVLSVLALLGPVTSFSLELTMLSPVEPHDDAKILRVINTLALFSSLTFSICLFTVRVTSSYLHELPVAVIPIISLIQFLQTCVAAATLRTLTDKEFRKVRLATVLSTTGLVLVQILVGLVWHTLLILLLGYLVSGVISSSILTRKEIKFSHPYQILGAVSRYKKYFTTVTLGSILNTVTSQFPVFFASALISLKAAAYIGLVQTILAKPLSLISGAIGQAVISEWQEKIQLGISGLRREALKLTRNLIGLSVVYLILCISIFKVSWSFILGPEWSRASNYFLFLGVYYIANIAVIPIAWLPELHGRTDLMFKRSIYRLTVLVTGAVVANFFSQSETAGLISLSILGTVSAIVFFVTCLKAIEVR